MPRRKRGTNENGREDRETWTPIMDDALVDAFLHQHNIGNRVNGVFTSKAYGNIVKELQEKINKDLDKEKVKNRWKNIKSNFSKCFDLFKNELSGFAWNSSTKMWSAEPEVWQKLIEANPQAKGWMYRPIPNYDKLMILYGNDGVACEQYQSAKELKRRRRLYETENEFMHTIDDIDKRVSHNEVNMGGREFPDADKLILRGLQFFGFHGVKQEEKSLGQKFLVDIDAWLDLSVAGITDNMSDTVSYTDIYRIAKEVVEGPSQNLLESVAHLIANSALLNFSRISAIRVKVGKPHVAVPGTVDYLGVEIMRRRNNCITA